MHNPTKSFVYPNVRMGSPVMATTTNVMSTMVVGCGPMDSYPPPKQAKFSHRGRKSVCTFFPCSCMGVGCCPALEGMASGPCYVALANMHSSTDDGCEKVG